MISDIATAFYERYPNVRFATKRDVERVCANPSEFLAQLQHWVSAWETELPELEELAPKLRARYQPHHCRSTEVYPLPWVWPPQRAQPGPI